MFAVERNWDSRALTFLVQEVPPAKKADDGIVAGPSRSKQPQEPEYDPDADDLAMPPPPPPNQAAPEEPEFEASDDEDDAPEFPTTHELTLKDHTKVVSALALDPSGARVLSGSHDYDCKLWDFGGMDWRCKPFKTWEPAGTYYVRSPPIQVPLADERRLGYFRFTTSNIHSMDSNSWSSLVPLSLSYTTVTVRNCEYTSCCIFIILKHPPERRTSRVTPTSET